MTIEEIKSEMLIFQDGFGFRFLPHEIEQANTKEELGKLLDKRYWAVGEEANDVQASIGRFINKLGLQT